MLSIKKESELMEVKTKSMKKSMLLICFAILIWWLFDHIQLIGKGINLFFDVLSPFIIGLVIAFILNKPMSVIENKLLNKAFPDHKLIDQYKRSISFLITLLLFLVVLGIILVIVIPNLIGAGEELAQKLPHYFNQVQDYIENSSMKYPQLNDWILGMNLNELTDQFYSLIKGGFLNWLGSTFTVFSSVIGGMISTGLGFIFAVYFLLEKEDLILSIQQLLYATFPLSIAGRITYIANITQESFSQFLIGQTLDALALGGLFLVSMLLFRFPYALMVSIIITISAFVPIVGSFVGLAIGAFLIFVENPKMAGLFIILFLVLQQIEGNLIYPKIVGKASGLSSIWILAAVTLGGSLMGILGIILFVPLFSVLQKLLTEYTQKRLKEKNIDAFKKLKEKP